LDNKSDKNIEKPASFDSKEMPSKPDNEKIKDNSGHKMNAKRTNELKPPHFENQNEFYTPHLANSKKDESSSKEQPISMAIGTATSKEEALPITPIIHGRAEAKVKIGAKADAVIIPSSTRATHYSLNDSAAKKDSIGFTPYIKALAKLLMHKKTKTPLVVGICGEWGAGKTSFMHMLKNEIHSKTKIKTNGIINFKKTIHFNVWKKRKSSLIKQVWFNAWKYENKGDIWTVLLQDITIQLENDTFVLEKIRRRLGIKNIIFDWGFIFFIFLFVQLLVFLPYGDVSNYVYSLLALKIPITEFAPDVLLLFIVYLSPAYLIYRILKKYHLPFGMDITALIDGQSLTERIENVRKFDNQFERKLDDYLAKEGKLIIYIDDLDRCSPEHVVEVIEAINLFLDAGRCVFVLGMDMDLISIAIESKYKTISDSYNSKIKKTNPLAKKNKSYGEKFIEKIIQIPVSIPTMTDQESADYYDGLMFSSDEKKPLGLDKRSLNIDQSVSEESKTEPEGIDFPISNENEKIIKTLIPFLEKKPREIKRFYNMLALVHFFYYVNKDKLNDIDDASLSFWFFIKYKFHLEVQVEIRNNPPKTWPELIHYVNQGDNCIKDFFEAYKLKNEGFFERIENDKGRIKDYELITRFLNI